MTHSVHVGTRLTLCSASSVSLRNANTMPIKVVRTSRSSLSMKQIHRIDEVLPYKIYVGSKDIGTELNTYQQSHCLTLVNKKVFKSKY